MAGELMTLRVLEKHFGVDEAGAMGPDELAGLYRGLFARFESLTATTTARWIKRSFGRR
jgi:hypothetical protein